MSDEPKTGPFGLNPTRIMILLMGALVLLISIGMFLGGPNSYQALRDASNAAKEPTAEQLSGD
ncbi:hypothetical protein [Devosia marina]|uniref:Uncharacterized protein n=2 Tax=Devosia marina TaxID=2683198 RepID=A0A7X3K4R7_9HYPH|nr:hypothetical protein [Devosia marina]MVS99889.1 hypothetical protein [Devosia marina]